MRLTLRTMLCYLDDVLEPDDAKELGAKIEESEYASNIVHRIRTSMRRLRLGSPAPSGKKMGLDPNTVADYLDNTLPAERVPDFERVCLDTESEMYLAEVAACHQILTLVLGEPAEVSPALRERMYALAAGEPQATSEGAQPEAAHLAGATATAASPDAPAAPPVTETPDSTVPAGARQKPEVPEYLKAGGKRSWWPLALTAALLLLLAGGALWSTGALDSILHPKQVASAPSPAPGGDPLFSVPPDDADDDARPDNSNPKQNGNGENADSDKTPANGTVEPDNSPPATNGDTMPMDVEDSSSGGGPSDPPAEAVVVTPPKDPVATTDDSPPPIGDGSSSPEPIAGESPAAPVGPDAVAVAPDVTGPGPVLPPVDKIVGHYASTGQVMAYFNTETSTWQRMPQRAAVKPGMQLQSLPTYRPQLLLENKLQITFAGEATAAVLNPVENVPAIVLHSGRALVATIGEADNKLMLRVGDRDVTLTMGNVDAEIAVEVARFHQPGVDPRTELSHVNVTATVARGQVEWHQVDADPVTLDAGQSISFLDEGVANVKSGVEPPKWVKSNEISDIDRLASATLEPLLDEERPLQVTLEEQAGQAQQSRVEVRSLATRSLASLRHFDRIIDSFNDESLKSYWQDHLIHLQQLLARSRTTAEAVATAAARRKGEQAPRIYRLLWGFSPKQLSDGSDKLLVEYLKNESLDVRVLAIQNLQRITGRTHLYHAHFTETRRRTAQREWDQLAAVAGSIVYAEPPVELPPRKD